MAKLFGALFKGTAQDLQDNFSLPGENFLSSHACAFVSSILLQGRLYLTENYLLFYSPFNGKNLIFGASTKIQIDYGEITRITRRRVNLVNAAISIESKENKWVFTSFIKRDVAFREIDIALHRHILATIQNTPTEEPLEQLPITPIDTVPEEILATPEGDDEESEVVFDRIVGHNVVSSVVLEMELPVSADELLNAFFLPDTVYQRYLEKRGESEFTVTSDGWPQTSINDVALPEKNRFKRTFAYTHPVKTKIPFMPKTCTCTETHKLYMGYTEDSTTAKRFVLDISVRIKGVLLSENFVCHLQWDLQDMGEHVKVVARYGTLFIKEIMFKSAIEKQGVDESREVLQNIWLPEINSILNLNLEV